MNEHDCMLTTIDNPYDPFDQFDEWLMFDKEKGYDTCEKIGRLVNLKENMTQKEIDAETDRAIDKIIEFDFLDIYKKVTRSTATAH